MASPNERSAVSSSSSSSSAGDSYIGSLISVTSKSEIRYEGVLAAINTHDSTLALQNVRTYGTEGRRKDGPQVPASDNLYEYIVFRGSDIKDLQVKSSPGAKSQEHNDPAIIQSHYAYVPSTASSASVPSSYAAQSTLPQQSYADAYSLYQTGSTQGSWVSSPASTSTSGASLITPMYWQGYAGFSSSLGHAQQQSAPFLPPSVMRQDQMQHLHGHALTSMANISEPSNSLTFPSTVTQLAVSNPTVVSSTLSSSSVFLRPSSSLPSDSLTTTSFTSSNQEMMASIDPISSKVTPAPSSGLPFLSLPHSSSSMMGFTSASVPTFPPLLNPDQLTLSGPTASSSNQKLPLETRDLGASFPSSAHQSTSSGPPQAPVLPLPQSFLKHQHGVTDFTEEFDFSAMNEKFNKDEVWGALGKAKQKGKVADTAEDYPTHDKLDIVEGHDYNSKIDSKSVYNKDDFFDTLSCASLNQAWSGRTKFSERMKLDTETFGDFQQKPPLGRGSQGPKYRGSYNRGRGYGYYGGRGRGVYRP